MATRVWIVIGVLVVVIAAVAVLVVRGYGSAPLRQVSGRTCVGCIETHWNGRSSIRASRLSGTYAFREDSRYRILFAEGTVQLAGEELAPGCHEGVSAEGDELRLDDARDVRILAPASVGGCPDDLSQGTSGS